MRRDKSDIEKYIETNFVKESSLREKIVSDLVDHEKDGIQVSPSEGQLLKFFGKMIGAKKIVEFGTLFGYSTSWFLETVGKVGKVWSFEKSEEHYQAASSHLKASIESENLQILLGNGLDNCKKIESEGPFDLIFIDANKSAYMDYFNWADQHLRPGGLIIADNTFLFGEVFKDESPERNKKTWKVMKELNQTLGSHPNYMATLIPTKEGLTVAQKKRS